MATEKLNPHEFIITLDNRAEEVFKGSVPVNLVLRNPHAAGEYDVATLSMLKVIVKRLNDVNRINKLPDDKEIEARIKKFILELGDRQTINENFYISLYKMAFADATT